MKEEGVVLYTYEFNVTKSMAPVADGAVAYRLG
jgi:hypothetical protein